MTQVQTDNQSYWQASATEPPVTAPSLKGEASTDVAIIGGGFTGLSAALHLARDYGIECTVLEGRQPGWGASGRNGGFCGVGSSKLGWRTLIRRFGLEQARTFANAQREAVELVRSLVDVDGLRVDPFGAGEMCLAHTRARIPDLLEEQDLLEQVFGEKGDFYTGGELAEAGLAGPEFHAGLHLPWGFGLHPLNYVRGLARTTIHAGGRCHGDSTVESLSARPGGGWVLTTLDGVLNADRVLFATNGYTPEKLSPPLRGALMPVRSNILTTRPLTGDELDAQGFTSPIMAFDSRNLLHYFRLLPDGTFLFGGRGGLNDRPSNVAAMSRRIEADFRRMFPAWREVPLTHGWSGYICMSRDRVPHVAALGDDGLFAAMCYHGSGVAMGTWSGMSAAAMIAGDGKRVDKLPGFMRKPLPGFPLPALRPLYFKAAYAGYKTADTLR